jgi:hypothetical protein
MPELGIYEILLFCTHDLEVSQSFSHATIFFLVIEQGTNDFLDAFTGLRTLLTMALSEFGL